MLIRTGSTNCGVIFDLGEKEKALAELEQRMQAPGFWNDNEAAQHTIGEINELKSWVEPWNELNHTLSDLTVLYELAVEEDDGVTLREVEAGVAELDKPLGELEFRKMFDDPDDRRDAILTIHPGAGGTESADWAQMLMRMYLRWAEKHRFETDTLDLLPGEEAGIKSVTIEVSGDYAYGYLKAEVGVHRLVRISPFDANSRRHTSFASVFVYPEVDSTIEIDIKDEELKIDTYRASGAGGQHVNKTSSAVRITHLPTGIVVQCQNQRSQHQNRAIGMKILYARLYQLHKEEEMKKQSEIESQKMKIEWGSQIRSYVFHPYNMVKDHRTNIETGNVQAVMDGDIDLFIRGYLSQS